MLPGPARDEEEIKAASLPYEPAQSQEGVSSLPSPPVEPRVIGGW